MIWSLFLFFSNSLHALSLLLWYDYRIIRSLSHNDPRNGLGNLRNVNIIHKRKPEALYKPSITILEHKIMPQDGDSPHECKKNETEKGMG